MTPELMREMATVLKRASVVLPEERDQLVGDLQKVDTYDQLPERTKELVQTLRARAR